MISTLTTIPKEGSATFCYIGPDPKPKVNAAREGPLGRNGAIQPFQGDKVPHSLTIPVAVSASSSKYEQ